MNLYKLKGDGYSAVALHVSNSLNKVVTQQFYMQDGCVAKVDNTTFRLVVDKGKISVKAIESTSTDVVIIPGGWIDQILPDAMLGLKCKTVVAATDLKATFCNHALYGSTTIKEFRAFSRDVVYEGVVFPDTIVRRDI